MDTSAIETRLEQKGVKPTSNRISVMRQLLRVGRAVSLAELEDALETLDKSSIFRVLSLFAEKHIVHAIEDGSGSVKYEVCTGRTHCSIEDMHAHFYCLKCHNTYCLEEIHIPRVVLPAGFVTSTVNYMIKGVCPNCNK